MGKVKQCTGMGVCCLKKKTKCAIKIMNKTFLYMVQLKEGEKIFVS